MSEKAYDAMAQTAGTEQRPSEIADANIQLSEVVGTVIDRLDHLEHRLGAVMRPPSPSVVEPMGVDRAAGGVPLADVVLSEVARLRVINDRLINLAQRVAL